MLILSGFEMSFNRAALKGTDLRGHNASECFSAGSCGSLQLHTENCGFLQNKSRGPPTIYSHHKRLRIKKRIQRGWCTNCQNLKEQQNVYHPQDYTGDVHHGFCGGGVRIAGLKNLHCPDALFSRKRQESVKICEEARFVPLSAP